MLAETCKRLEKIELEVIDLRNRKPDSDMRDIIRRLESIEATLKVIAKHVLRDSGGGRR